LIDGHLRRNGLFTNNADAVRKVLLGQRVPADCSKRLVPKQLRG
jgi:hypothetical protein